MEKLLVLFVCVAGSLVARAQTADEVIDEYFA